MRQFLNRLFAGDAAAFGETLANSLSRQFPRSLDDEGLPKLSAERLGRILEKIYAEAQILKQERRLGYFQRTRLCHGFQWRLRDMGYSKPFVDLATEGLVVYLNKPPLLTPEQAIAQEKRARKAQRVGRAKVNAAEPAKQSALHSRENPSPRYLELVRLYREMHEKGETFLQIKPEDTFPGLSLPVQAPRIKKLIKATHALRILDYGSGKGQQYQVANPTIPGEPPGWPSIQTYWGVDSITCYDPSYPPFSELPRGAFDGVISTDVLEHCPEDDVPWIIDEIFSYARKFVFMNVACYPAKKRLPTGENAHCTIRPKEWWADIIRKIGEKHPGVRYEVWIQWKTANALTEEVIRG